MSRARKVGTAAESAVVAALTAAGFRHVERRTQRGGGRDQGDVAGIPGVVIEVKAHKEFELAEWVDEAQSERRNADAALGAVWHKRRGRADAADWYVTITGAEFAALLRAAGYGVVGAPGRPGAGEAAS